jgi:toxin YoeB
VELEFLKLEKSGKKADIKKVEKFIIELANSPRTGLGKPEKLKHYNGREIWSRRINQKDRFIYLVIEEKKEIVIVSILGHYQDK